MLNLNVCKREGGNEGQDTRYWWYCWDLYAVGVFCIFLSADIITRKSWCNDIEAMAKVNILPQQVQTIGTLFAKKRGEVVLLRAGNFHYQLMPKFPCSSELSPKCSVTWPRHQLIPRVRRPPASFWFASSLNFLLNISLSSSWSGWKTFRPTSLTTCCGAIPCLSIVVSAKWTFVCQQVVCGGVPNVLFSWAATQVYFWRSQMGGGWV